MRRLGLLGPALLAAAMVALLLASCSSGKKSSSASAGGATATTAAPATTETTTPETTAPPTTAAPPATAGGPIALVAKGIHWSTGSLRMRAGQKVIVKLSNMDAVEHNFTFAKAKVNKDLEKGTNATVTFTAPGPGTYEFHCEYHPQAMKGTVTVS